MSLLPKDQPNLLGAAGMSIAPAGKPLTAGAASLIEAPAAETGPLDEVDGETSEEVAAKQAELARAILSNREQREGQKKAIELANDTEFWFAVYFQTREQKEAFLRAIGYGGAQDPDKYLDGQELAEKQGIKLPARPAPYKVGRIDKKLADLT